MTSRFASLVGLLALTSVGCGASTMIGDVPDASPPNLEAVGTTGHNCTPPQFAGDQPFTFPAGLEGVWTGYVQGGVIGLGSDAVQLTFDHAADGTSQIHLVYGTAPPPPPATVATDAYPPGDTSRGSNANSGVPIEGFPYRAHNVHWDAFGAECRLRFMINSPEPCASWCHLQSSYVSQAGDPTYYSCIPGTSGFGPADPNATDPTECVGYDAAMRPIVSIPCAQLYMCVNGACFCDACGCDEPGLTYAGVPTGPQAIDLLFDTDSATGSFQLMRAP